MASSRSIAFRLGPEGWGHRVARTISTSDPGSLGTPCPPDSLRIVNTTWKAQTSGEVARV